MSSSGGEQLISIILIRHGEREDRRTEHEGKNWLETSLRPQDPQLSEHGFLMANESGNQIKELIGNDNVKIFSSPLIRCLQTADSIANVLGSSTIYREPGLIEESRCMRGRKAGEPPPVDPIYLPLSEVLQYSQKIDEGYSPLLEIEYVRDYSLPNTVREVHPTLTDSKAVLASRCHTFVQRFFDKIAAESASSSASSNGYHAIFVTHGATIKSLAKTLNTFGPESAKMISGSANTSGWAQFKPLSSSLSSTSVSWEATSESWLPGGSILPGGIEEDAGDAAQPSA